MILLCLYFYPRSPCGERRLWAWMGGLSCNDFYPRSPCGERQIRSAILEEMTIFLSTLSLRRATEENMILEEQQEQISIHALLAESDYILCAVSVQIGRFLSTLSLRRATVGVLSCYLDNIISIHALLAESDLCAFVSLFGVFLFLSTLSLRRATGRAFWPGHFCCNFYPRSPCGERPNIFGGVYLCIAYFYPRSPCGERQNSVSATLSR